MAARSPWSDSARGVPCLTGFESPSPPRPLLEPVRRRDTGADGVLMGAHGSGVHRDVPVDLTARVGGGLDLLEQVRPGAVRRPKPMALVHGLPRAEPLGKVAPVRPGPDPVENPVDHLSVITPPSAPPIADRQKRPQLLLLSVCQITPPHAGTTSRTAQSHTIDRTGSSNGLARIAAAVPQARP